MAWRTLVVAAAMVVAAGDGSVSGVQSPVGPGEYRRQKLDYPVDQKGVFQYWVHKFFALL